MAITSGFFNSVGGDRRYDAHWFAQYFSSFIANGIFPNPSTNLQVTETTNMRTVIKAGKGWINGYFVVNDSDFPLQHDVASGTLNRIDRVVMRLNYPTRQIEFIVRKGANATNPVAAALQRNTDYHELALADVYIAKGTTQIMQSDITDNRLNNNLCGIVHGTVQQVDTTTIFNQYQSWVNQQKTTYQNDLASWTNTQKTNFTSWQNQEKANFNTWRQTEKNEIDAWQVQEKADFEAWFQTVKSVLDGDTVGSLINLINTKIESAYHVGASAPSNTKMIWISN